MTKRFEISGSQYFSSMGLLGASMFIFSPLADAACYWWLTNELLDTYGRNLWPPLVGMMLCSIAFLSGLVLIIVGREQTYTVREVDPSPNFTRTSKRLWEL
ncbi:hypothetical protein HFO93_09695 [Rhizobium leguminosarum]|uniref:hypothetical protein n=1 Tax=Rhizobium TaxID=379 RepID=UPI0007B53E4F|nr:MULTISPECIES: hypothetical protein [Rhizobium]MDH6661701.1 hypothetical protein [Rhizobium sophorae]KZS51665.1 hypothetical protein AS890_06755 [Rhizobium anhuiense bv. trifolii]MBB4524626.1 hypothetical protein [Rhizobium leguminosarum]MBY5443750.1 hypothetical protein [Rhizobium leguminosarum]QIO57318.1 hypothetical protein HA463_06200 [Rhizobium leguminosarum bv. trifolii]